MSAINQPKIDLYTEEDFKALSQELQRLLAVSTYCENAATAAKPRLVLGLRNEGLDGGSWLGSRVLGTTAERTADKIVQPLHAIAAECHSAASAAVLFDRRFQQLYVEMIRQARAMRTRPDGGAIKVA